MKNWTGPVLGFGTLIILAFGGWSCISWDIEERRAERRARETTWEARKSSLIGEGCKVTGFVSRGTSRPTSVWTCPDGRAELGE